MSDHSYHLLKMSLLRLSIRELLTIPAKDLKKLFQQEMKDTSYDTFLLNHPNHENHNDGQTKYIFTKLILINLISFNKIL